MRFAKLNDGQRFLAFNDLFIGASTLFLQNIKNNV
jgi:hypothetical protein